MQISANIILQNKAQLKALFKDTCQAIIGNCDTLIYLGGNEPETHKYITEMLGKYIRREHYAGSMSRSFYVGDQLTENDIHAQMNDGIPQGSFSSRAQPRR